MNVNQEYKKYIQWEIDPESRLCILNTGWGDSGLNEKLSRFSLS